MEFGEILRALREEKKISREALANMLNISYSAVSKYETNIRFPDKETLVKMADYFDVSIDYLLGRSNIRETAEKILKNSKEQFLARSPHQEYNADDGLTPEAVEEIEKFKEFMRHKYAK
ncbi:MAG: helix-turn-helix domain-containing protein [Caulobacteraceae bacterium]